MKKKATPKKRIAMPKRRAEVFKDKRTKRTRTRQAQQRKYIDDSRTSN